MNVRTGNIGSLQGMSCIAVLSYGTPLGRPKLAGQGFRNPQNVQLTGREPCQPCIGKRHRVPTELKHNVRAQSWTQLSGSGLQSLATRWYDSSGLSQGRGCSRTVPVPCAEATRGSDRTQAQCASSAVDTAQRSQSGRGCSRNRASS